MTERTLDYRYLPDRPERPIAESTLCSQWSRQLTAAVRHALSGTGALVVGGLRWDDESDDVRTAPDLMVVPTKGGDDVEVYTSGGGNPLPSACIEFVVPTKAEADVARRVRRQLRLGVGEVYTLDPESNEVFRARADGDSVRSSSAVGERSAALGITFVRAAGTGQLAMSCPSGLVIERDDNPFTRYAAEQQRLRSARR